MAWTASVSVIRRQTYLACIFPSRRRRQPSTMQTPCNCQSGSDSLFTKGLTCTNKDRVPSHTAKPLRDCRYLLRVSVTSCCRLSEAAEPKERDNLLLSCFKVAPPPHQLPLQPMPPIESVAGMKETYASTVPTTTFAEPRPHRGLWRKVVGDRS